MDDPSPDRGVGDGQPPSLPTDPVLTEALRLLRAHDPTATSHDPRSVVAALAGLPQRVLGAADHGTLDYQSAALVGQRARVVHRILKHRSETQLRPQLELELASTAEVLCVDIGFDRVLAFTVGDGTLDIVASRFRSHQQWSQVVFDAAKSAPPALDLAVRESAVVLGQQSAVVPDAQDDPGTWKPVVEPLQTDAYVSAPIVVGGQTVATLHGDCQLSGRLVGERDRETLGLVADELSYRLGVVEKRKAVLTEHQQAVMELVALGYTNSAIADTLFVSAETIKSHLSNIYERLSVGNRDQAVAAIYDLEITGP